MPSLNGQPRKCPDKLHADKDCDFARCRRYLKQRGITARIARRGVEGKERLGRHRWVVERTHAWFAGFGNTAQHVDSQSERTTQWVDRRAKRERFAPPT